MFVAILIKSIIIIGIAAAPNVKIIAAIDKVALVKL